MIFNQVLHLRNEKYNLPGCICLYNFVQFSQEILFPPVKSSGAVKLVKQDITEHS